MSKKETLIIDIIRGAAAQAVLLGHLHSLVFVDSDKNLSVEKLGVVVFFIISGYVITHSLISKDRESGLALFIINRFTRIYCPFIFALLLVVVLDSIVMLSSGTYKYFNTFNEINFVGNILMLQDAVIFKYISLINIDSFGSGLPFWSLSLEWWIYLTVACIYFHFGSRTKKTLIMLIVCPLPFINLFYGASLSLVWLLGSLVYFVNKSKMLNAISSLGLLTFIVFFLFLIVLRYLKVENMYDMVLTLYLVAVFYLLIKLEFSMKAYIGSFFKKIADYSYSLYLTHYTIISFLLSLHKFEEHSLIVFISLFFICNIFALFFSAAFEKVLTKKVRQSLTDNYFRS